MAPHYGLIVRDNVYLPDQDGRIWIFKLSKDKKLISEQDMRAPISHSPPVVACGVLYIPTLNMLYAIAQGAKPNPDTKAKPVEKK